MKSIINLEDFPKPEDNAEFWASIDNDPIRNSMMWLILNEIRSHANIEDLSPEACKVKLAKIHSYVTIIDLPEFVKNQQSPQILDETTELPD